MKHISPIIYKTIPTQYAFFIHEDGTLETKQLTTLESKRKFNNTTEAINHVESINKIL